MINEYHEIYGRCIVCCVGILPSITAPDYYPHPDRCTSCGRTLLMRPIHFEEW